MAVAAESMTSTVPESSSVSSDTASMDSPSGETPSQSHNNNAEMTVQEAKLLLEKYKGDHNKFDDDDITDEELLGVNETVAFLECSDGEKVVSTVTTNHGENEIVNDNVTVTGNALSVIVY